MVSKTFRLFISSTFSDFNEERNRLQEELFPKISMYCAEKGFSFQPIDLRWGINDEAQLDQKTLELCINEVQSCKTHPHPNFLIMLGDRYGWIPLPYIINKNRFDDLLSVINDEESKSLLREWYLLDKNQVPASYLLRSRVAPYDEFFIWSSVENHLRILLQKAVKELDLNDKDQRSFFFSATEHEVNEGVYKYLEPTPFQEYLQSENRSYKDLENENIFGFLRHIDTTNLSNNGIDYLDKDLSGIRKLKSQLKKSLPEKNILELDTTYKDSALDSGYLDRFISEVELFLKRSIDQQVEAYVSQEIIAHEQMLQEEFLKKKTHLFIGQTKALSDVKIYLESDVKTPMIIYGPSGSGKSSFMAKAIMLNEGKHKSVYAFIGATTSSSNSKGLLRYICTQIDDEIVMMPSEDFTQFSIRVRNKLLAVHKPTYIFIDALDQLTNDDQLSWLPDVLPEKLKIVISVLDDETYKHDSRWFKLLDKRYNNSYRLPKLVDVKPLIFSMLLEKNRTLQKCQIDYLLQQYSKNFSPLYLKIVVQEIQNWHSYDLLVGDSLTHIGKVHSLKETQMEVIKEYIKNLVDFYYIDEELVAKVLSYLYISEDGLSEVELIDLLSEDKDFLQILAPETYHKNLTQRLPVSIWVRLLYHIELGVITKEVDGYILMQFFHREIFTAVKGSFDIKYYHRELIYFIEKLIIKKQGISFSNNRLGTLYSQVCTRYIQDYDDKSILQKSAIFIASLENKHWIKSYTIHVLQRASVYEYAFDSKAYIELLKVKYLTENIEFDSSLELFIAKFYHKLGGYEYLHVEWNIALKTMLKAAVLFKHFIEREPSQGLNDALESLSQTYGRIGEMYGRYSEQCEGLDLYSKQKKIRKAIVYHIKSEALNVELLESDLLNIEYARKLGVVYERLAHVYILLDDTANVRRYFAKAFIYKYRAYNRESDFNGFALRKLFIVIVKHYETKGNILKVRLYLKTIEKSIMPFNIVDAIVSNNQYYLEQYFKFYTLADTYLDNDYSEMLHKIKIHLKPRGLSSEYT